MLLTFPEEKPSQTVARTAHVPMTLTFVDFLNRILPGQLGPFPPLLKCLNCHETFYFDLKHKKANFFFYSLTLTPKYPKQSQHFNLDLLPDILQISYTRCHDKEETNILQILYTRCHDKETNILQILYTRCHDKEETNKKKKNRKKGMSLYHEQWIKPDFRTN